MYQHYTTQRAAITLHDVASGRTASVRTACAFYKVYIFVHQLQEHEQTDGHSRRSAPTKTIEPQMSRKELLFELSIGNVSRL